jgi:hypothetical protein
MHDQIRSIKRKEFFYVFINSLDILKKQLKYVVIS